MTFNQIAANIVDGILSHPSCSKSLAKDRETLIMVTKSDMIEGLKAMYTSKRQLEILQSGCKDEH